MIREAGIAAIMALVVFMPGQACATGKSGVDPQVISLPKGPGSLEGLGESFEPQLNTGTATYLVKIAVSPGVNKHQPDVALEYNSGYGNSVAGLGWDLNTPYIQRRTDKGLPAYADSDRFTYSRSGEIVPLADGSYRMKVEGLFMRFRKNGDTWEAWEKNGTHLIFGADATSRQGNTLGTFRWFLQKSVDTNGNEIRYNYATQGGQLYLSEIRYGIMSDTVYKSAHFFYETRPDSFSDYHSRSKVVTSQRLKTIEVRSEGKLVRQYCLDYHQGLDFTLLSSIAIIGADGVSALPPFSFGYSACAPDNYKTTAMSNIPPYGVSLAEPNIDLVDINGDSLPDLIYTEPGIVHTFYINKGKDAWDAAQPIPYNSPQHLLSQMGVMMADMDGDGLVDLFVSNSSDFGYYKNKGNLKWEETDWVPCKPVNGFSFESQNMRMLDLNNDGLIDVLRDDGNVYLAWINGSGGPNQWKDPEFRSLPDQSHLSFYDPFVKLADMNGDRMEDLVSISGGFVTYYPSKGNGDFDHEVVMSTPIGLHQAPVDHLSLVDINNDGFADIVLVDNGSIRVWFNRGNNSFRTPVTFSGTPEVIGGTSAYRFADMNGDGFRDLLITSESSSPRYQYVDFTNGTHPNLLTRISNGLGQETIISYKSSTDDYLDELDNGTPWATRLPFPVQVVKSVAVKDLNSGQEYVTDYFYRDGYYDGVEKEFRGFGGVTKLERGDASAPTLKTVYSFDVGKDAISRKGMVKSTATLSESGTVEPPTGLFDAQENTLETRTLFTGTNGEQVTYSFIKAQNNRVFENGSAFTLLSREFDQDVYGNTTKDFNYGIVSGTDRSAGKDELLTTASYHYDLDRWVLDRPDTVGKTDLSGTFVNLQKSFYDSRWNLIRQESSPDGTAFIKTVRNDYDGYGNIVRITDANDHWRQIGYDPLFHTFPVSETIGGLGLTMSAGYDYGLGVVTSFTDFNQNTTSFGYDTFGRLTSIVKPGDSAAFPTQSFDYSLASPVSGIATKSREQSGQGGTYDSIAYFDGLGRKLQARSEGTKGRWVVNEAATFNQRKGIARKWLPYFAASSAYGAPAPALVSTAFSYDPKGRSVREVNPDGSFRSTLYQPLSKTVFDEEDNAPASSHAATPHTFVSDGLERLVEVRERNGSATYTTRYGYDGLNNLTKITDNAGNVKTMLFDGLGRKTHMYDPDKHDMSYSYDPAGNLLSTTDARKQTVSYTYDEANRIVSENFNGVKVRYHYDADLPPSYPFLTNGKGKLTWVEDEAGREYYSYDRRGNVVMKARESADFTFVNRMGYDAMDRLASLTYPDGYTITYAYNSMNQLESIPGFVSAIDYHPTGQKSGFSYANGIESGYLYDNRQRLASLKSGLGAKVLQNLAYGYDRVSNITSIGDGRSARTPEDLSRAFVYDDLYRLTLAKAQAAGWQESYQYNSIGNMTYKSDLGNMAYGLNGAGPHALSTAAGITYGYDVNGNIAAKTPGFTYAFDHRDRMASAHRTTDGGNVIYTYDYKGNRVTKTVTAGAASGTTIYADKYSEVRGGQFIKQIFAGDRLVARISTPFSAGSLVTRTRSLASGDFDTAPADGIITLAEIKAKGIKPGALDTMTVADTLNIHYQNRETKPALLPYSTLAQAVHELNAAPQSTGTVDFYLPDHLGSASIVTDAAGAVVEESVFYPYGKDRKRSGAYKSEYRFTGKELDDETGLHYFGARYYDSVTGRFVSVDPIYASSPLVGLDNPQLLSSYSYPRGPINYVDHMGLIGISSAFGAFDTITDLMPSVGVAANSLVDRAVQSASNTSAGNWLGDQMLNLMVDKDIYNQDAATQAAYFGALSDGLDHTYKVTKSVAYTAIESTVSLASGDVVSAISGVMDMAGTLAEEMNGGGPNHTSKLLHSGSSILSMASNYHDIGNVKQFGRGNISKYGRKMLGIDNYKQAIKLTNKVAPKINAFYHGSKVVKSGIDVINVK